MNKPPFVDSAMQTKCETLIADTLAEAKIQGASACEVGLGMATGLSTSVRLGEVETIEHHQDRGLGITVYFGQTKGSASTSDISNDAIKNTVRAACDIARYTSKDTCAGIADATLMPKQILDLSLSHPWNLSVETAIELAEQCETAARSYDARITNSEGAMVASHESLRAYGNSHGFIGSYPTTRHSISCSVIATENGQMQQDSWFSLVRDQRDFEATNAVGERAAQRALKRLGAKPISSRNIPVLFAADIAVGLFGHLVSAINGGTLYRKASFLLDHLGKKIFPDAIHLHEQPHLLKGLGSVPYDSDGVITYAKDIVKDGILTSYLLDSYAARRLGMQTTSNAGGIHNLICEVGNLDFDGLVKQMDTGLIVTKLMGHGINLVTGDYSRGAAGFWVENGAIQYPVEEITIAGNLKSMFAGIVAIGNDVETRGRIRTGSILLENMTVAGK